MRVEGKSTRYHERRNIKLPLEVVYRESDEHEWTENARTEQLTICGVGFSITRIVEPNRLVRLRLPMPKSYRLFDFSKETYEVWGMVRHLDLLGTDEFDQLQLAGGAALIGAKPPPSYLAEPKTLYDLKPVLKRGNFWGLRELPRRNGPFGRLLEVRRAVSRSVVLQPIDERGRACHSIKAETLNVSESGAAVLVDSPGVDERYVLLKTGGDERPFIAAVRGRHRIDETTFRIHLEFISGKWTL